MPFFDCFEIAIFNPILGPILGRPPNGALQWPNPSYFAIKQLILQAKVQGILGPHWVTHRWGQHLASIRDQLYQDWSSGA